MYLARKIGWYLEDKVQGGAKSEPTSVLHRWSSMTLVHVIMIMVVVWLSLMITCVTSFEFRWQWRLGAIGRNLPGLYPG
jgi:hypothetical protein